MADDDNEQPAPAVANPAHVEDINAPIIFTDGCFGAGPALGDNLTLNFVSKILDSRFNPPNSLTKTVVRLVIPRSSARDMIKFIGELLDNLESGGETGPKSGVKLN